jgi:hypothetical protein
MRKKVIFLSVIVFMLSFLPAYISGVSAPDTVSAENTGLSVPSTLSENPAIPKDNPAGVSPRAVPIRNIWGAATGEKVDLALHHSDNVVSWSWSRQHPVRRPGISYIQPIYPNARIVLQSPVDVSDIQSFNLITDFKYTEPPTGAYNLAYDVFLRAPGVKVPKAEIMVWLDWTQPQPSRYLKGLCSDGYNDYSKYWWTKADGSAYNSFLLTLAPGLIPGPVNLKALIDHIQPEKNWYISEVELGTEVWDGSGAVELTTYYLELNGARL